MAFICKCQKISSNKKFKSELYFDSFKSFYGYIYISVIYTYIYIYIYLYTYIYLSIYLYIYIYIYRHEKTLMCLI